MKVWILFDERDYYTPVVKGVFSSLALAEKNITEDIKPETFHSIDEHEVISE